MEKKLSFTPQFHHEILVKCGVSGWIVSTSPLIDFNSIFSQVIEEQRRIESEGGTIVMIDAKSENGAWNSLFKLAEKVGLHALD